MINLMKPYDDSLLDILENGVSRTSIRTQQKADEVYLSLLKQILKDGQSKTDRTGVGTKAIFGAQLRFNLQDGFPLLTTKKVHFKSVLHELLWFLKGMGNIQYLKDNRVSIWDEWADDKGNLGPVYGVQWRKWTSVDLIEPNIGTPIHVDSQYPPTVVGVGYLGNYENNYIAKLLRQTWQNMLDRCYNKNHIGYHLYGGQGVFVDHRWHSFENFIKDASNLENWFLKKEFPDLYSLDKDIKASNFYSPETCIWSSSEEQSINNKRSMFFEAIDPNGNKVIGFGASSFARSYGLSDTGICDCLSGKYKSHKGWKFKKLDKFGLVPVIRIFDQIRWIIAEIKNNPDSRRLCVSAWNVRDLPFMKLQPCHVMFQFFVNDNKLSCHMYQRSVDTFLGLPFNIASYSLLTHIIAQVCNLEVGEFVWSGGDVHIYNNHFEQVNEQLSRVPYDNLPTLSINKEIKDIDDFVYDDFELKNYEAHPAIKAPIAV